MICETENYKNIKDDSLKILCGIDGDIMYDRLKNFVEINDPNNILYDMQNLMLMIAGNTMNMSHVRSIRDSDDIRTLENLLILKTYKRLKKMENICIKNKNDHEKYSKYANEYKGTKDFAKIIRDINLDTFEYIGMNNNVRKDVRPNNMSELSEPSKMIQIILTPHKINQELLIYELLFYKPDTLIIPVKNMNDDMSEMISSILNRFNPIIQIYLEDCKWNINYKNTLNFNVRQNKVVFSNTIRTEDETNIKLIQHLDMLKQYIKRVFKLNSINYKIVEDNKFYMSWILIEVGYL